MSSLWAPLFWAALQGDRGVQIEKGFFEFVFAKIWKAFNEADVIIKIISEKILFYFLLLALALNEN